MELQSWLDNRLSALKEKNCFREIPLPIPENLLDFSSNNYLGLADHPALKSAIVSNLKTGRYGSGASRLISGTAAAHRLLEERLAQWYHREAALFFNSGYQAGVGVIPAIADRGVIFSDELNHACIIDGCRLSRAEVAVYRHRDMGHLESLLKRISAKAGNPQQFPRWIVSESVFSMEGTAAPCRELVRLKQKYNAFLMLDEAHGIGVYGKTGRGLAEEFGLSDDVDLIMGTFSKAMGSFGAFVTGSQSLMTWIANTARSFIFTTALPPAIAAANEAAIGLVDGMTKARAELRKRAVLLRDFLKGLNFETRGEDSPIIPVVLGDEGRALQLAQHFLEHGLWIRAIRPPTVPTGTSRLRISLSASQSPRDEERLQTAFQELIVHHAR